MVQEYHAEVLGVVHEALTLELPEGVHEHAALHELGIAKRFPVVGVILACLTGKTIGAIQVTARTKWLAVEKPLSHDRAFVTIEATSVLEARCRSLLRRHRLSMRR